MLSSNLLCTIFLLCNNVAPCRWHTGNLAGLAAGALQQVCKAIARALSSLVGVASGEGTYLITWIKSKRQESILLRDKFLQYGAVMNTGIITTVLASEFAIFSVE
jgi:hypothetical protein